MDRPSVLLDSEREEIERSHNFQMIDRIEKGVFNNQVEGDFSKELR